MVPQHFGTQKIVTYSCRGDNLEQIHIGLYGIYGPAGMLIWVSNLCTEVIFRTNSAFLKILLIHLDYFRMFSCWKFAWLLSFIIIHEFTFFLFWYMVIHAWIHYRGRVQVNFRINAKIFRFRQCILAFKGFRARKARIWE